MRRRLFLGALFVVVAVFAAFAISRIFPPEPYGLADDWRVFVAASQLVQQGGSPYDTTAIHVAEQSAQHYATVQPSLDDFTDLPLVAVLLRVITWLPYWWSFAVFTALGVMLAATALWRWMRDTGWRTTGAWLVAAMCSWPMLLGFFSGQFDALLLAGTIGSLLLMRRNRPVLAALCMLAVLFKPHLLWPLPALLAVTWSPARERLRFIAVAAIALAAGALAGFLIVPGSSQFFGHLLGFGSRVSAVQPDLSGIPGIVQHLPAGGALVIVVATIGVVGVVVLGVVGARQATSSFEVRATIVLTGVAVWLACAPYAHPNDDIVLFPLLALVAGADARHLATRSLPLLAVASLAVLPMVWPFHVLTVPITPVAVALVALAGFAHLRSLLRPEAQDSVRERQRRRRILGVVVESASGLSSQTAGGN
ncbi:MAG: DUF2029 domain-containing protein [Candidatus Dormibacteraeota bacterium]|nr:DUF2029 domain-containing protein [Candidatus Dormibacteraeota bacterium]